MGPESRLQYIIGRSSASIRLSFILWTFSPPFYGGDNSQFYLPYQVSSYKIRGTMG